MKGSGDEDLSCREVNVCISKLPYQGSSCMVVNISDLETDLLS